MSRAYPVAEDPLVTYTRKKYRAPEHHLPKRERIYNELTVQFLRITRELSEEKKTELDGLLWDLALRLVSSKRLETV